MSNSQVSIGGQVFSANRQFFLKSDQNHSLIPDDSINSIISSFGLDNILKPNIYDFEDSSTDMKNMEPFFLVLYAMNGNDFNVILDKKEPPSRAGSASVQGKQNAHGIVTGFDRGWKSLSETSKLLDGRVVSAKQLIDLNFAWLYEKIKKGNYKCVVYPADRNGMWDHGIYNVNDDVRKYIIFKLIGLMCKDDVAAKLKEYDQDLSQIYTCPYK